MRASTEAAVTGVETPRAPQTAVRVTGTLSAIAWRYRNASEDEICAQDAPIPPRGSGRVASRRPAMRTLF